MNFSTMVLHGINVLLIALLGSCRWIGWPVSLAAAFIFAVRERHHEAVVWYAALHEPLVLLFILLAVLSLIRYLEGGGRMWWAGVASAWFLALASKESGVVLAALLPVIACLYSRWRLAAVLLASGALSTGAYFLLALAQSTQHQHFNDGTFSFQSHILATILNSAARGLWIWGGLSLIVISTFWRRANRHLLGLAAVWFFCGLLPYSFLSYMPRIPSRHHYIASVGSALLIATAFWLVVESRQKRALISAVLSTVFIAHNWGYLWISKKRQFEWRASIVENFLVFASQHSDTGVVNGCRELNGGEAVNAIRYRLGLNPSQVLLAGADPSAPVYHCPPPPGR